jgi:hypothetical protein
VYKLDGEHLMIVNKVGMALTGKNNKSMCVLRDNAFRPCNAERRAHATSVFHRLVKVPEYADPVYVCTYDEILIYIQHVLPGKYTQDIREHIHLTFRRVEAGDPSLHAVIIANGASNETRHSFARAGLPTSEAVVPADTTSVLGKRLRDNFGVWAGASEKVNAIYAQKLSLISSSTDLQERLGFLTTEKKKLISNDVHRLSTQMMTCSTLLDCIYITNAPQTGEIMDVQTALTFRPIDIRQTIERLGYTFVVADLSTLGTKFKTAFVDKYPGQTPLFHPETMTKPNGKEEIITVNDYLEKDLHMVEAVIHAYFANKAAAAQNRQLAEALRAEKAAAAEKKKAEALQLAEALRAEKAAAAEKKRAEAQQKKAEKDAEKAEKKAAADRQKQEREMQKQAARDAANAVKNAASAGQRRLEGMGVTVTQSKENKNGGEQPIGPVV